MFKKSGPGAASTECTCTSLRMAARRLTQAYDAALAPERLTTSQFGLLGAIGRWPGPAPTVGEMADRMALDRTTLGHNLRPLERDGLVSLVTDATDRRIRRIVLTALGRERREAAAPLWRTAQDRFDAAFGRERSSALRTALLFIAHDLDTSAERPGATEHNHVG